MIARRSDLFIMLGAVCWFIITAYCSIGYEHFDEHYQIIEIARTLDHPSSTEGLPWEYFARVRSALQPVIAHGVFSLCEVFSIVDPYTKAFALRLLTAILAVMVIRRFTLACRPLVRREHWTVFLLLSYFFWPIPFICVRFSSETWSGLALLLALALVLRDREDRHARTGIGLLLGLAFLFRYQSLIATAGLLLWLWSVNKVRGTAFLTIAGSFLVIIGLGTALDSWFYGTFTIAPLNYLRANLIEGKAASFGVSPWYHYFYLVFRLAFFPIGTAILLAAVHLVLRGRNSPVTWMVLPFLLVHIAIGRKELRFLYPLVPLVPFILVHAWQSIPIGRYRPFPRLAFLSLAAVLLVTNVLLLIPASLKPADMGQIRIARFLHELPRTEDRSVLCAPGCDPFAPWGGTAPMFYRDPGRQLRALAALDELDTIRPDPQGSIFLLITERMSEEPAVRSFIQANDLRPVIRSMPDAMIPLLKLYGGFRMKDILVLYGTHRSDETLSALPLPHVAFLHPAGERR